MSKIGVTPREVERLKGWIRHLLQKDPEAATHFLRSFSWVEESTLRLGLLDLARRPVSMAPGMRHQTADLAWEKITADVLPEVEREVLRIQVKRHCTELEAAHRWLRFMFGWTKEQREREKAEVLDFQNLLKVYEAPSALNTFILLRACFTGTTAISLASTMLMTLDEEVQYVKANRVIHAFLLEARLFSLSTELFQQLVKDAVFWVIDLLHAGDLDTTESLSRPAWRAARSELPFPEVIPYDATLILLDEWLRLPDTHKDSTEVFCGFYVHQATKLIAAVFFQSETTGPPFRFYELYGGDEEGWIENPRWYLYWAVVGLIDTINAHKVVVLDKRQDMEDEKSRKFRKRYMPGTTPKPFQIVELAHRFAITRGGAEGKLGKAWTFRIDVRSHERILVRRGELPLDVRTHRLLERKGARKAGYKVYAWDKVPDEVLHKILIRGHPRPRSGEWIAVLVTIVDEHIAGPEDAPYVPRTNRIGTLNPMELSWEQGEKT